MIEFILACLGVVTILALVIACEAHEKHEKISALLDDTYRSLAGRVDKLEGKK